MGWFEKWSNIAAGGIAGWKDGEHLLNHKVAYEFLATHNVPLSPAPRTILVPLCGDSLFVPFAFSRGHRVVAIDLVPVAIQALQKRFPKDTQFSPLAPAPTPDSKVQVTTTTATGDAAEFQPEGGAGAAAATLIAGDFLVPLPKEVLAKGSVDVVFDKDSFGALGPNERARYVPRVREYLKPGGFVLLECKWKDTNRDAGPPYHVSQEMVKAEWVDAGFEVVGHQESFYPLNFDHMKQQCFLLKKN